MVRVKSTAKYVFILPHCKIIGPVVAVEPTQPFVCQVLFPVEQCVTRYMLLLGGMYSGAMCISIMWLTGSI
jgi:hypothetical protein